MVRATLKFAFVLAVVGGSAGPAWAQHRPATQPESAAVAPSTQPDLAGQPAGQPGMSITFLLTRNLPEHLNPQYVRIWQQTSPEAKQVMLNNMTSILHSSEGTLQKIVQAKKEFDRRSPAEKEELRHRAQLIEQVLAKMSATDKAVMMNLPPKERAEKLRKLIAELKAQQARDAATGTPSNPK